MKNLKQKIVEILKNRYVGSKLQKEWVEKYVKNEYRLKVTFDEFIVDQILKIIKKKINIGEKN